MQFPVVLNMSYNPSEHTFSGEHMWFEGDRLQITPLIQAVEAYNGGLVFSYNTCVCMCGCVCMCVINNLHLTPHHLLVQLGCKI